MATHGHEQDAPRTLDHLAVLELGHHIAASYCTKLLADLGADVQKVEGPRGDPLRAFGPLDPSGPAPTSGLFHYLNANKRGVVADLQDRRASAAIRDVAEGVDVLVENFRPGRMESFGLGPDELLAANPRLVYVRISNYGQTGRWRDRRASELTLQAETGMGLRLGEPGEPPTSIAGRLSEFIGGTFAAAAALAAVSRAKRCGAGSVVDVSLLETLLCSQSPAVVLDEFVRARGLEVPQRQRVMPGWVPCQDGEVCVSTLTAQNWLDLCLLIERPEWAGRMQEVQSDEPTRVEFLTALSDWTQSRNTDEAITTLQALRISAAVASDGRMLLELPPFVARGFLVPQPGASFVRPAAPYRLSETPVRIRTPAPALAAAGSVETIRPHFERSSTSAHIDMEDVLPLAGLRVVDLTGFLAGGHLTGSMAALGAEVIKVESSRRPDGYRFVMTYPEFGDEWWELSALWQGQNFAKKSLSLDLTFDEGRALLAKLIVAADVVAENFTPRVIEDFGFGYEKVHELNPRIVMVRMPAFGLEGPWRDRAGFAYNIEQVAGLAQNGLEGGPLVQPAGIVDIVNGQHALVATLAALRHRDHSGYGQLIEVSQVETVACLTADQIIEYQLTDRCRQRIGNRSRACAPQGIYPCRDDRWIAVTVATDAQWRSFCDEVSMPQWANNLTLRERLERHDELDELIVRWSSPLECDAAVGRLQALRIPAGKLATLPEVATNPQLADRGYYQTFEHPLVGTQRRARPPVQFSFGELVHSPAPRLGQHNREVLRSLGLDDENISDLLERGIIGEGLQS